ncbi:putative protein TPRXL [Pundamilia nyererei]|uniref:Uncharacterized protein n=1 Tax=Pundamilia nyererei TaxID=303518 RepID=A0A3B4FJZ7_9CICH|nr:PREDICTED: putative protein TPRXL [Pundamilia nyererei]
MMETKLWIALCALLAIYLGSAVHADGHTPTPSSKTTPSTVQATGAPVLNHVSSLGPDAANHSGSSPATNTSSNGTVNVSSSTTTENTRITIIAEPGKDNVTDNAIKTTLAKNENITNTTLSPSQSSPTTAAPINIGTTHVLHTSAGAPVTPTPSLNQNASHHETKAPPATSAPASEPTKPESITNATTTKSNTNSSTASVQKASTSQPTSNTSQSNRQSTQPSIQTSSHTNNPSELNVNGDGTAQNSPGLDPLLAGLVSAFIVAAVIITLLLFLKLRRRGNGPEFRRLQDLPMDDMEDTPLSMYSY